MCEERIAYMSDLPSAPRSPFSPGNPGGPSSPSSPKHAHVHTHSNIVMVLGLVHNPKDYNYVVSMDKRCWKAKQVYMNMDTVNTGGKMQKFLL